MAVHDFTKRILPHILYFVFILFHYACASDGQQSQEGDLAMEQGEESAEFGEEGAAEDDEGEGDFAEINDLAGEEGLEGGGEGNFGGGLGGNLGGNFNNFNNLSNINDLTNGISDATTETQPLNEAQTLQNPLLNGPLNPMAAPADPMAAPADPMAAPAIPMAPAAPNNMATMPGMPAEDMSGRVVRYVVSDGTPIYDKPQADGATVTTMFQGDPLVVLLQGDWAQITDDRFIMVSALSEAAVPRVKTPGTWTVLGSQPSP